MYSGQTKSSLSKDDLTTISNKIDILSQKLENDSKENVENRKVIVETFMKELDLENYSFKDQKAIIEEIDKKTNIQTKASRKQKTVQMKRILPQFFPLVVEGDVACPWPAEKSQFMHSNASFKPFICACMRFSKCK